MISLRNLAALAEKFGDELDLPVEPLRIGDRVFDVDRRPAVMGCVNLSRDSSYRESIAVSAESAVRKGRVLAAQGADVVDVGAESSQAHAVRVDPQRQVAALLPVVRELSEAGVPVSVETYAVPVARACLAAGARMVNLTGSADDVEMFDLVAEHGATVVLCYSGTGVNVREASDVELGEDPLDGLLDYFADRVALARSRGADRLVIDPGLGFHYRNLTDPVQRVRYQTQVLLNTFRLRRLGLPICHAMPTAFDLFEEQVGIAENFFAVLAYLGGTGLYRVHEVARASAVLRALHAINTAG